MKLQKFSTPQSLAKMARANLSEEQINELISLLQLQAPRTDITLDLIYLTVAREFGVTVDGIKSDNRHTPFSDVRRIIAVLIMKFTGNNLVQTAAIMNKTHATIIYYRKKHEDLLKTDSVYREKSERLERFFEEVGWKMTIFYTITKLDIKTPETRTHTTNE